MGWTPFIFRPSAGKAASQPEVQKFAGALQGHRANKGVFITTSSYSREELEYVARIWTTIIVIGGRELAQLMIDHER